MTAPAKPDDPKVPRVRPRKEFSTVGKVGRTNAIHSLLARWWSIDDGHECCVMMAAPLTANGRWVTIKAFGLACVVVYVNLLLRFVRYGVCAYRDRNSGFAALLMK